MCNRRRTSASKVLHNQASLRMYALEAVIRDWLISGSAMYVAFTVEILNISTIISLTEIQEQSTINIGCPEDLYHTIDLHELLLTSFPLLSTT